MVPRNVTGIETGGAFDTGIDIEAMYPNMPSNVRAVNL
jgi:hypothetical protein